MIINWNSSKLLKCNLSLSWIKKNWFAHWKARFIKLKFINYLLGSELKSFYEFQKSFYCDCKPTTTKKPKPEQFLLNFCLWIIVSVMCIRPDRTVMNDNIEFVLHNLHTSFTCNWQYFWRVAMTTPYTIFRASFYRSGSFSLHVQYAFNFRMNSTFFCLQRCSLYIFNSRCFNLCALIGVRQKVFTSTAFENWVEGYFGGWPYNWMHHPKMFDDFALFYLAPTSLTFIKRWCVWWGNFCNENPSATVTLSIHLIAGWKMCASWMPHEYHSNLVSAINRLIRIKSQPIDSICNGQIEKWLSH